MARCWSVIMTRMLGRSVMGGSFVDIAFCLQMLHKFSDVSGTFLDKALKLSASKYDDILFVRL